MDLELTDDQKLFLDTTVRFIESELPVTRVRELHEDPTGYDRGVLGKAAELGWFAMLVPEDNGGGSVSGNGLLDATLVAEQLGRFVQPGPFIPMNVVGSALADHGSPAQKEEHLPALVAAETVFTWAPVDTSGIWDEGAGLVATKVDDGYSLEGSRGFVQDAQSADQILVLAQVDGRPAQFLVPTGAEGVTITPLVTLDLSRRLAEVTFEAVVVGSDALVGEIGDHAALGRELEVALALVVAETVGVIDALFAMTVEYSKDRIAFGRPIGSFQALKHIMADLGLYLETCKAGAVAAARAVQDRADDAAEVTHMVAAYVGDMAAEIAQECLQIHGGIGYTWEHDLHLLMRRAQSNAVLYGEPGWHRERICQIHGL